MTSQKRYNVRILPIDRPQCSVFRKLEQDLADLQYPTWPSPYTHSVIGGFPPSCVRCEKGPISLSVNWPRNSGSITRWSTIPRPPSEESMWRSFQIGPRRAGPTLWKLTKSSYGSDVVELNPVP